MWSARPVIVPATTVNTHSLALPSSSSFFFWEWNREKYFSLIACVKPVDSLHDKSSQSACASAGVEGESLFAADGRHRCGRERSVHFCGFRFPRSGKHNPHASGGGDGCAGAAAIAGLYRDFRLCLPRGECFFAPRCVRTASLPFHADPAQFLNIQTREQIDLGNRRKHDPE